MKALRFLFEMSDVSALINLPDYLDRPTQVQLESDGITEQLRKVKVAGYDWPERTANVVLP